MCCRLPRRRRRELDSIVFDIGTDALRRVPMMEPMRTQAHVGTLFDECETAAELLRRLGT